MLIQERRASDSSGAAAANGPYHAHVLTENGGLPGGSWEAWFREASEPQRLSLLELARCQGLLYSHQVPPSVNGQKKRIESSVESPERKLQDWLSDKEPCLSWSPSPVLNCSDQDLDLAQCEAVARALATPDVCLIQGLPGAGKSRVAAEIVRQATRRGDRVLLMAKEPVALDVILRRLADDPFVFALRVLDAKESDSQLPADIRPFTLSQRRQTLQRELRELAHGNRQAAESACRRRGQEELLWPQLRETARCWQDLRARLTQVAQQRDSLLQSLQRLAQGELTVEHQSVFPELVHGLHELQVEEEADHAQWLHACQGLTEKRASCQERQQALSAQRCQLVPLAEARAGGRWWSLRWWKALFRGDLAGQLSQVDVELKQTGEELAVLDQQLKQLAIDENQGRQHWGARRQDLVDQERARQEQVWKKSADALGPEQVHLAAAWQSLVAQLEEPDRPSEPSLTALEAVEAGWRQHQGRDEAACRWAQEWQHFVENCGEPFIQQLLSQANVRAIPWAAHFQAVHASNHSGGQDHFDLLVLDEAERLTESELISVARLARRWVLIADSPMLGGVKSNLELIRPQPLARLNSFEKLWSLLHGPEVDLPYAWSKESDRWCCSLRALTTEEKRHVESERLADAPDIELRILSMPKAPPTLAQVVFPVGMSLVQAKGFINREVQEVPIMPAGRSGWWREDGDRRLFQFGSQDKDQVEAVELEPGLKEWFTPVGATWALEFHPASGWSHERAEAWVRKHVRVRDTGRTMFLETPHRHQGGLARTLREVLLPGLPTDAVHQIPGGTGLELVSVPPPRKPENGKKTPPAIAWPKEGAGFEQDLTAPRLADRLPTDLRAELPRQGLVNYFEAQAIVKYLEALASAPPTSVLVLALHEAQAELIRRLAARSLALRSSSAFFAVGVPADFSHQEASVVLLSCTRSHVHRAVPFGQNPRDLGQALTRARDRLLIFTDPGTLVKRSQWQGPLEHHDAASANREAQILARLVRCLSNATGAVR